MERLKSRKYWSMQIVAALICLAVVGILVISSVMSQQSPGSNYYTNRPTFYNLPVIIYSNSTHTEEMREHISYCTFEYEITSSASRIANAPADVPIIVDGYSLGSPDDWQVAEALSKALKNGSVIVTLWSHAYSFMNMVSDIAYGHGAEVYADNGAGVLWLGLWNGNNSAQASVSSYHDTIGQDGPSMTTLTQAYEWSVRMAHDQPYHPTLYP